MKIKGRFNKFWHNLKAILTAVPSTSTVFNQYRDWNDEVDLPEAATIRVENLRRYMAEATSTASILVVGEAAGPWGCRFSGIPFTGERQLLDPSFPIGGKRSSKDPPNCKTNVAPPYVSKSAKIFWDVMRPYYKRNRFLIWDAFPLHSHDEDDVLTVRNPTRSEVAQFREALWLIEAYMKPTDIVAVGRKAEREFKSLGEPAIYVRHPSMGGKTEFAAGMQKIFKNKTRKR